MVMPEPSSPSTNSDLVMKNLDYIKKILMEEGMEDATCREQVNDVSYQNIYSSFHEILGEKFSCNSYADSSINNDGGDVVEPHQHFYRYGENSVEAQDDKVDNLNYGFFGKSTERGISLPATGHPQSGHYQEKDEVGYALKHDSGCQSHILSSHTFLRYGWSIQTPEHHVMKMGMYNSRSNVSSSQAAISLSSNYDTLIQNYCNFVKVNDDVMASRWGEDADVQCFSGYRCLGDQEQRNKNSKLLPSTDEDFSLKLSEVVLSFEDLKLNDLYRDLYVGEPSSLGSSTGVVRDSKQKYMGRKFGRRRTSEIHAFVDVREVLVSCAQAVATGEARRANEILKELREVHGASAKGTSLQRTAYFFGKALSMRMRGLGEHHFRAKSHSMPSITAILKPSSFAFKVSPFGKVCHYFANQSILRAAEGAARLHIVDYGLLHGIQWPCLINALADRQGGPPLLVITGIGFPQPGVNPTKMLKESGRQLAAYAKMYNVPFQYHTIVLNKFEDLDSVSLNLLHHTGEVLVVNCMRCLRHLADESANHALATSPRQKLLTIMRSLNPHLLLIIARNSAYNSPFFVSRFREALHHYSTIFDMLDTLYGDTPERVLGERSYFYRDILNIVGCEGAERVDRPETYKQWHGRITKAGFEQLPIPPRILSKSRSYVKQHHHKDFFIHDDGNGWMLMGWKGRIMVVISAWKPLCVRVHHENSSS